MAHIPLAMLVHTVTVAEREGQTGSGKAVYGAPRTVRAMVAEKSGRTVASDGEVVASSARFVCRLAEGRTIGLDARVTLPSGRVTRVVSVSLGDDAGRGAWQHAEIAVQ